MKLLKNKKIDVGIVRCVYQYVHSSDEKYNAEGNRDATSVRWASVNDGRSATQWVCTRRKRGH